MVTELATGLGMIGDDDIAALIRGRPGVFAKLRDSDWDRLDALRQSGVYARDFTEGFANGQAFLYAQDALRGRRPRIIEDWRTAAPRR